MFPGCSVEALKEDEDAIGCQSQHTSASSLSLRRAAILTFGRWIRRRPLKIFDGHPELWNGMQALEHACNECRPVGGRIETHWPARFT
jgi:hypothetical protein